MEKKLFIFVIIFICIFIYPLFCLYFFTDFMMRERMKEKGENSFNACVSIIVYHNREVKAVVQRSRGHAPVTDITL